MCGGFGEVTVIIGLVINFLAFVSLLFAFRVTSTYLNISKRDSRELVSESEIISPSPRGAGSGGAFQKGLIFMWKSFARWEMVIKVLQRR